MLLAGVPPMVTNAPATKFVPAIATDVPPVVGPAAGAIAVTAGGPVGPAGLLPQAESRQAQSPETRAAAKRSRPLPIGWESMQPNIVPVRCIHRQYRTTCCLC